MKSYVLQRLQYLVAETRVDVPLYRDLYCGSNNVASWRSFRSLPVLTRPKYNKTALARKISRAASLCLTRTLDDRGGRKYHPRLLSYDDLLREYEALDWFLKFLGVAVRKRDTVLIITAVENGYCMADLGKMLASYAWEVTAITREALTHNPEMIQKLCPAFLVYDPAEPINPPRSVKWILQLEKMPFECKEPRACGLLSLENIGTVAVRKAADNVYSYNQDHFYFERGSRGNLLVTSFVHRFQPLIRYELPLSGAVDGAEFSIEL